MTNLRTKLQDFSQKYIFLFLAVYIICQPLLDVFTGLGAQAGHSITAGVVVRSLFMVLAFLYAVFVSDFPGKKQWMIFTGALCAYLAVFMGYMFSLGGLSLCIGNIREMVKTFFVPFVLVFLWAVYKQYNCLAGSRVIGLAGALYASVIPIAVLTGTSFISYGNSGEGYRGWFYAANEVGCIIALTAPFTIAWCLEVLPTVTRQTWWKGALCVWSLIGIAVTANFLGTKIVFGAVALYCAAAFVWQVVMLVREPSRARKIQALAMGGMLLVTLIIFLRNSPLLSYLLHIYIPMIDKEEDITLASWGEEIQAAARGSWLHTLLNNNAALERLDQILSRRLLSSAPAVQVYTEGGLAAKLLGIGYAKAPSYSREMYFMVEMDPLAMLIRHGVVGFLLYYVPYLGFLGWSVVKFFRRPAKRLSSLFCCTALYCTLVGFGISTIAGHALVSPAVATFILVVAVVLYDEYCFQDQAPQENETL